MAAVGHIEFVITSLCCTRNTSSCS